MEIKENTTYEICLNYKEAVALYKSLDYHLENSKGLEHLDKLSHTESESIAYLRLALYSRVIFGGVD